MNLNDLCRPLLGGSFVIFLLALLCASPCPCLATESGVPPATGQGAKNDADKGFDVRQLSNSSPSHWAVASYSELSRGDKKPLELFLAGVQGLDGRIRAMLCQAATA